MISGVLFYTAYQFLFIGFRNRKHPEYITFGLIVLLQAVCALIELFGVLSNSQHTYLVYRHSYYNITAAINILFFYFISKISGYRHKFWTWCYLCFLLITLILTNVGSTILFINQAPHYYLKIISTHFYRTWTVSITPLFGLAISMQFIVLSIFSLLAWRSQLTANKKEDNFILYSLLIFILGSTSDLVIDFGIIHYPISSYFYLILIIYMSTRLYKNVEMANKFKDEAIEGEQRLRQIIDLVPNLIFAKDSNGRFILANKAMADIYGTTPDRLPGHTHEEHFHIPMESDFFRQKDLEVIRSGKPLLIPEETITDKEGNLKILQTVKIPFSNSGSKAILGVSTDITAIKKAESILKYNELLLETIFDSASVAMVLIDNKADVLKINKAGRELGLETNKQFIGRQPGHVFNCIIASRNEHGCGDGKECSNCTLRSAIQITLKNKSSIIKIPYTMSVKDQDDFIEYNLQLSTSYLEINNSQMVLLVLEDFTAIEKVERALMDSEYRYKLMLRTITDYIYTVILHETGEVQTFHTIACYSITGYNAEEFEADQSLWFTIIVEEDREMVLDFIRHKHESLEKQSIEHRIVCKDGSERWVSNTLVKKHKKTKLIQYDGIISDITKRKRVEEALDQQNKLLNTMLDNLPIGIFMVNAKDGLPLLANEHAKKLLGQGIMPNAKINDLSNVYKAFKAGTSQLYPIEETPIYRGLHGTYGHIDDMEVERPDGTRSLIEIVGCPVFDANNNVRASLVGFYDITARKNAEQALRESERMLSIIFEYSHIGISLSDYHGTIKYMNPAFCNLLNFQPDQIVDNSFYLFTGFKDGDEELELIDKLRKGELPMLKFERKFTQEQGYEIWVQMQISCFKNGKGEVTNFIAIAEDITDRKIALDSLRASEEKFRNIFNTSNDAIIIIDIESHVLEVNQIFLDRTGLTPQQLKNLRLIDIIFATDHEEAEKQLKSVMENKVGFFQSSYTNQRGEKIYIEINGHSIIYNGIQAALLISRNITDRVILQQKMMNAIIDAEEKERSFFSQELHDGLGPILSTIKLYVEWIQNPDAKSDKSILLDDALVTIEEAIVSVKEISNRLSPNVLKKFGLETAIRSFTKKIESFGKINFDVNINLKERIQPEIETMLYRVLVEAINNSLKYADATNIVIQITASSQELFALFQDDGKGFDMNETLIKKSGHGLFNMQHRVEVYEGLFTLKSSPGKGTEIEVKIPSNKYILTN